MINSCNRIRATTEDLRGVVEIAYLWNRFAS